VVTARRIIIKRGPLSKATGDANCEAGGCERRCSSAGARSSDVAERAGVQRHTFYAHFPDDRSLYLACSGLALERASATKSLAWYAIKLQLSHSPI
jgi:hypothetical protein